MNLPQNECCCCDVCCTSGPTSSKLPRSSQKLNATDEDKQMYDLHPPKRKRQESLFSSKPSLRQCVNLVCIIILLSFANVGSTSDIPLNTNNFQNGESTPAPSGSPESPSIPTASSSSFNNADAPALGTTSSLPSVQPGNQPSVTQSYFINGYANQIQKTNVSMLRALAGNKPLQLQYRTVCPFGNIVNDVSSLP